MGKCKGAWGAGRLVTSGGELLEYSDRGGLLAGYSKAKGTTDILSFSINQITHGAWKIANF